MQPTSSSSCIVTVGVPCRPPADHPQVVRDFRRSLRLLREELEATGFQGTLIAWDTNFPSGCPDHTTIPFAFKPFALLEAKRRGHRIGLWLDASVRIKTSLDPLFDLAAARGYVIFCEDHSVGEYCKDSALATLGISREAAHEIQSCWSCAVALDFNNTLALRFLDRWRELACDGVTFPGAKWNGIRGFPRTISADRRIKGHRYDQTAASVIAHQLGMRDWLTKKEFCRYFSNDRLATYVTDGP